MVRLAITFLILALVAAVLGFGNFAGDLAWIAKILILVFAGPGRTLLRHGSEGGRQRYLDRREPGPTSPGHLVTRTGACPAFEAGHAPVVYFIHESAENRQPCRPMSPA